ncbi:hypothetical protein [Streptomyces sp. NPDC102437]|uniref:hypothetical protein n=1 Tax=Streptomyces sp. NPDC102437 TaxID=3366175 RepID=UPI0038246619
MVGGAEETGATETQGGSLASSLPSPLESVADMRATAKWILAALAVTGAALLGGGPLAAVGKIHGPGQAVTAYAGLLLSLVGIGWAIWRTADALIPPLTTPRSLDCSPLLADLRVRIACEPESFYGPFGASANDLHRALEFHSTVARNIERLLESEGPDGPRRALLLGKLTESRMTAANVHARLRSLWELAHAWQVRAQLRNARLHSLAGGAVAALGAVVFLSAAS